MINNSYQQNALTIHWAGNWSNSSPRWFLDEYDIKIEINLKDCFNNEIVFSDILQKNSKFFQNHIEVSFMAEWIEFFLDCLSLEYSLECHFLLKQCFQKGHSFESAW